MNYSTSPLPIVDTLNDHTGFFFVLVPTVVILFISIYNSDDTFGDSRTALLCGLVAIGISGLVSWNTGEIVVPKNTPVEGTYAEFLNERHNETRSSGKNGRDSRVVTVHRSYVVYEINGAYVQFPATAGTPWPKKATFYGN